MYVVLSRTRSHQLENVRKQKRIAVSDLQLTSDEDEHGRIIHAELHVFRKHRDVMRYFPEGLYTASC